MPTYVRGNAVPNAVSYTLYKKNGAVHNPIVTKLSGKRTLSAFVCGRFIDAYGKLTTTDDQSIGCTNMINVADLADSEKGVCAYIMPVEDSLCALAFYSKENDYTSAVLCLGYNEIGMIIGSLTAQNLQNKAKDLGAKYVVLCTDVDVNGIYVNYHTDINIKLDDIDATLLPEGQSHTLVVEADGDGIEYEDSNYSNEVVWIRPVTPI